MTTTTRTETRTDAHKAEKVELDHAVIRSALEASGRLVKEKGYASIELDAAHAVSGNLLAFAEHCPAKPWDEGGNVEAAWLENFEDGFDIEGLDDEEIEYYEDNLRELLLSLQFQVKDLQGSLAEAKRREAEAERRETEAQREMRFAKWEADEAKRERRIFEEGLAYLAADNAEGIHAQLAAIDRKVDRNAELVRNFRAPRPADFGCTPAQLAAIVTRLGGDTNPIVKRSARIVQKWVQHRMTDGEKGKGTKPPSDFTLDVLKSVQTATAWAQSFVNAEKRRLRTRAAFADVERLPAKR